MDRIAGFLCQITGQLLNYLSDRLLSRYLVSDRIHPGCSVRPDIRYPSEYKFQYPAYPQGRISGPSLLYDATVLFYGSRSW